jgi:hypothetical protein
MHGRANGRFEMLRKHKLAQIVSIKLCWLLFQQHAGRSVVYTHMEGQIRGGCVEASCVRHNFETLYKDHSIAGSYRHIGLITCT